MNQQKPDAEKLLKLVQSERKRLKDDPNVVGVGMGPKMKGGKQVPGAALVYQVRHKYADQDAMESAGTEPLPEEIEGVVTDVKEAELSVPDDNGPPTGFRGGRQEDPLVGGTSTTVLSDWHSFPTGYGTLGGICFDASSGASMALSNAHVWGEETGLDVIQPWLPVDEYIEAGIKLLLCGPTVSYLAEWEWPSPLTVGLAAGAAAAAAAAAASDEEDPSRFGQRTTSPGAEELTEAEVIDLEADFAEKPYPGLPYSLETSWDYKRFTDQGELTSSVEEERKNQHVIRSKRVWTDRGKYRRGDRVDICAEIVGLSGKAPSDYYVVAQCFPLSDRNRVKSRVLRPCRCEEAPELDFFCFKAFPKRVTTRVQENVFPFYVGPYRVDGPGSPQFDNPGTGPGPALRIPLDEALQIRVTPLVDEVEVYVSHFNKPVRVQALNQLDQIVDSVESGEEEGEIKALELEGKGINRLVVTGGGGEGFVHGLCVDPDRKGHQAEQQKQQERAFQYCGTLELGVGEDPAEWGITLNVQTVDYSRRDVDPITAAQNIGGMPVSQNVADLGGCVLVLLLDHVFDVI